MSIPKKILHVCLFFSSYFISCFK